MGICEFEQLTSMIRQNQNGHSGHRWKHEDPLQEQVFKNLHNNSRKYFLIFHNNTLAVLNGRLYAVGGFDGSTGLNTAEVYKVILSPRTQNRIMFQEKKGVWHPIANMSTRRSSVGVGVVGSFLYSVGGKFLHVIVATCRTQILHVNFQDTMAIQDNVFPQSNAMTQMQTSGTRLAYFY